MDRPDADLDLLIRTIRQFSILNYLFSANGRVSRRYFFKKMKEDPGREYTLLDIGCGGCDIDKLFVKTARKLGLKIRITAIDKDARIIPTAIAAVVEYPEITVVEESAFNIGKLNKFDFIFSNHFFHHLDDRNIEMILKLICKQARIGFVINDLARSRFAYFAYTLFAGIFIRRSLAFYDGRISIRKGFRMKEMKKIIPHGLYGHSIAVKQLFPSRICIVGQKLK
jgi:2-polyprenyl-3-methyl-5-hydroxy-6-metoxy-1,4-benzoquinol methylase